MSTITIEAVVKELIVDCTPDKAFEYFTSHIGDWWPIDTHGLGKDTQGGAATCTMEDHVGGRVFETTGDGSEIEWGVVLVWQPGAHVRWTWHLSHPPSEATEVDVRFEAAGADKTRVTLTHDHWENWGEEGAQFREGYNSGWDVVFGECFAGFVAGK